MAQTVSPPPADAPRPLPRRGPSTKPIRPPRLVPPDWAWMVFLALVSVTVAALIPHAGARNPAGILGMAGTTVLLYLLGWRARDRATGVIAGLFLGTCIPFAVHAVAFPREAAFVLLTIAALFSFVAGSSLLALAFAGLATLARPDALLLGLLLLGLSLMQRRRRWALGGLTFFVIVIAGWAALLSLRHQSLPSLDVGLRGWLWAWACAPGMALVTWLLLPFCAELGETPRRARWLPVALWAVLYSLSGTFARVGDREATVFGLMPLWFVLAGGGLSRLLPALTEIPAPWARYLLAFLATVSLLGIRLRAEWPQPPARLSAPAPAPAHPILPPAATAVIPAAVAALHRTPAPAPARPAAKPVPKPALVRHPPAPTKQPPKAAARKASPAPVKPHPAVRKHTVYRRSYRPYRSYRRYYRRY